LIKNEGGRLLRDNVFGNQEQDAIRRDFTANALYYNIEDFSVWDYVGGVEDARQRILRMIGDPETRYREDPVRMLRAVRFAAKLSFTIHPDTAAPIPKLAWMLDGVPPARLFDEVNKVFLAGSAQAAFELLEKLQLLEHLFPDLANALNDSAGGSSARELVRLGLQGTDERVRADKSVTPTFLFAILMWPAILRAYAKLGHGAEGDPQLLLDACDQVTARQQARVAVPKRFTLPLRELVGLQPRFERREGRKALRLLNHPRFRAAYDFLVLRAAAGEIDPELAKWWTDIQSASADERVARVENLAPGQRPASDGPRRRRRRRRRRPPAAS
jgi:poly(A) polymerase